MHPERRYFQLQNQTTGETAIRTNLLADLYVALGDADTKGDWTVRVYWKPLVPVDLARRRSSWRSAAWSASAIGVGG